MKDIKWGVRKMLYLLSLLWYHIINGYFFCLKYIIPCKIITVEFANPLEPKSDKKLYGHILAKMGTSHIPLDDILDSIFKMTTRFLKVEKNIDNFSGLEIFTPQGRYQIFYMGTGYTEETNPARETNEEHNALRLMTQGMKKVEENDTKKFKHLSKGGIRK